MKLDKIVICSAVMYLAIPIIIFLLTWTKLYISIPGVILLLWGIYKTIKNFTYKNFNLDKKSIIFAIVTVILITYWIYISGIGGFGFQNSDINFRNAIFRDLVEQKWPVIYSNRNGILTYYIGFWIPSAFVGKIFGWKIANYFLMIWTIIGVFISIVLVCRWLKKITYLIPVIFIFFSGLDILGYGFKNQSFILGSHIEWYSTYFQFSSNTTQLFWVFNQAVPAWILTLLLINTKEVENIVFVYSFGLLFCPLPLIGLFPVLIYKILTHNMSGLKGKGDTVGKKIKVIGKNLKKSLSIQNIIFPLLLLTVFAVYYFFSLESTENLNGFIYKVYSNQKLSIFCSLIIFIFLEVGIYFLLIAKELRMDGIFIVSAISLCIIPNYRMGLYNDFAMRGPIPALLILMCYIIKSLTIMNKKKFNNILLIIILIIGSITPISEMSRYFKNGRVINDSVKTLYNEDEDIAKDINLYVSEDVNNNKYLKYIFKI